MDGTAAPHRRLAAVLLLLMLPALAGCTNVDTAMRRVDVLDRVFEPERFRSPPPPAATLPRPVAPQVAPPVAGMPKDPDPDPGALAGADAAMPPTFGPGPGDTPPYLVAPLPDLPPAVEAAPASPPAQDAAPAPAPPVDPAARVAALLRENPWVTRFWAELAPPEQARVTRALLRRGAQEAAPAAWDRMGLEERVVLLFGRGRTAPA